MAKRIDLSSIYTDERNLTVLTLIKKLIDAVENVDIGTLLYNHHFVFNSTGAVMDVITTDPTELHISYNDASDPGYIKYNDMSANEFFAKSISAKITLSDGASFNVLALGDQDTEVGALIDTGFGAVMMALTDDEEPEEIVDVVTTL